MQSDKYTVERVLPRADGLGASTLAGDLSDYLNLIPEHLELDSWQCDNEGGVLVVLKRKDVL